MAKKGVTYKTSDTRSKRFGGRMNDELYDKLEIIANYEKRSVSAQIEIIVREWIELHRDELKKGDRLLTSIDPEAVHSATVGTGIPAAVA